MVKLRWLQSAKDDLKEIYDYIAADSKKYASHQVLQIRSQTSILKHQPLAGKVVEEYGIESVREVVVGHYRIIYRVMRDDLIHIILVHHGARRFPRLLE